MAIRVGINGFGRIGRTVFRIISQNPDRFELCGINLRNLNMEYMAYTALYDSARLQDEAHRFAIEYHRSLRSKAQIHSVLDDIDGIGPARRKALLAYFKDIDNIKKAAIADLEIPAGMTRASAEAVYNFFHADSTAFKKKDNGQ